MTNAKNSEDETVRAKLSAEHERQLRDASGLDDEVIKERGYRTAFCKSELRDLGFAESQQRVPALVVALWDVYGHQSGVQIRPDKPREVKDKTLRYESPKGSHPIIDVPPRVRPLLADPSIPLWVTEGSKKADAGAARGLCIVSIQGVWGWRGSNKEGGKVALPDWDAIALNEREAVLAFDSDLVTKPEVLTALRRLVGYLETRGAKVRICMLPPGPHGEKTGLDDYFQRGGTVKDLLLHVQDRLPQGNPGVDDPERYLGSEDGTFWQRETKDGEMDLVRLANFTVKIITQVSRDDGVEVKRQLHMEALVNGVTLPCDIMAEELLELRWVMRLLGATAIIEPGVGFQRLGHAIQVLSKPACRFEYAHTGWRRIGGQYLFLHSGGSIGPFAAFTDPSGPVTNALPAGGNALSDISMGGAGPVGPVPQVKVDLPPNLQPISFPTSPTGDVRVAALDAVLRLLDVGPPRVMVPLVLAAFRATLGSADFSLFLSGPTGTRKTAVAAVVQQLFGANFDANHLPGNFSSTANANEEMLFTAKDVLVVIDDFVAPVGTDRSKFDAHADRLFRNSANGAARQRMRPDGSVKPPRPPRALPLATGEMIPRGQSLRARLVVIEIGPKEIDLDALTVSQEDGKSGRLSGAMAAFLQWLSPRLDAVREEMRKFVVVLRKENATIYSHGRTSSEIAELRFTLELFIRFASEAGVSPSMLQWLPLIWKHALHEVAMEQNIQQQDADPVETFLRSLVAALAAGRMHLADASDGTSCPKLSPEMLGWRRNAQASAAGWEPRGEMAGYVTDDGEVYLVTEITEACVRRLAQDNGDPLPIGGRLLRKRLHERGLLSGTEKRGQEVRLQIRKVIGKQRRDVVCMKAGTLWPDIDLSLHRE